MATHAFRPASSTFSNPTDQAARFLGIAIPGGFERYFAELGELMANEPSWPPADMALCWR
ncbi:MAG TPA: hypothetical protein VFM83_00615 [Gaiellaceae bacterium]|nr:hypothetical protein [Gaiellaceae bacterium]